MDKIARGKDIKCKWKVLTNGEEQSLEGRDLKVVLREYGNDCGRMMPITIVGNEVSFTFYGKDQRDTGIYGVTLWENYNKRGQTRYDLNKAFQLVETTEKESFLGEHDGFDVVVEVDLGVAGMCIGIPGLSAYDIAVNDGFMGTEHEWLVSLTEPALALVKPAAREARDEAAKAKASAQKADDAAAKAIEAKAKVEKINVSLSGTTVYVTDKEGQTKSANLKGKDGRDGIDGNTPVKGVDYFDGYTPIKGKDYFDGRDGVDGKPFTYDMFTPAQLEAIKKPAIDAAKVAEDATTAAQNSAHSAQNAATIATNKIAELNNVVTGKADKSELPTKTSQLQNDSNFINQVKTINGQSIIGSGNIVIEGGSGGGGYEPPIGGIPKADLSSEVQASLNKADTALQAHQSLAGKQDVISDLSTIRSGASAGATAVQPTAISDMETKTHASQTYQPKGNYLTTHQDISGKANVGDSYTKAESDSRYANKNEIPSSADFATKQELKSGVSSVASSVVRLETAIQNLPDGQAVSAEVARLSAIGFFETNEDGIAFVDSNLNIGVLIDNDGIHAKNLLEYEIVNN